MQNNVEKLFCIFFCTLKGKKSMFFSEKALPSGRKYNIME